MSPGNCPHVRYSPCLVAGLLPHLPPYLWDDTNTSYCPAVALHWQRCFSKPQLRCVGRVTPLHPQNNPKSTRHFVGLLSDLHTAREKHSRRIPSPVYIQQAWKSWMYHEHATGWVSKLCTAASHKKAANGPPEGIMLLHPKTRTPAQSRKILQINYSTCSELDLRKKQKKKVNDKKKIKITKSWSPESADTLLKQEHPLSYPTFQHWCTHRHRIYQIEK